ncbi:Bis(5\'-nucleosyl)-tetraphosphatase, symmetrical [gamma proteobacterium HdN1]|nr:Bis(5\'-nucleosyl)-tetraphosphatase, symmetrical [gamma proteobacterium HdN1]
MATYAIGDLQGCFASFQALLARIGFDGQRDKLWLTGDLINRGPDSLATLRWCHAHNASLVTVLGNHDLHFLAVALGASTYKARKDTFADILEAPDRETLVDWLRRRPLMHVEYQHILCHAGIAPIWTTEQAKSLAEEVEHVLSGDNPGVFLSQMYGNQPAGWSNDLHGAARYRVITNYFTRMRICDRSGALDLAYKNGLTGIPAGLFPWFQLPERIPLKERILFGHWAAIEGKTGHEDILALDTGCVWGATLTAFCLETGEWFHQPSLDAGN